MKILLVHDMQQVDSGFTMGAVEYHRMYKPHDVLDYHCEATTGIDSMDDELIQGFDLILFCRIIKNIDVVVPRLKSLGVKFGIDLDDYWHLDPDHILHKTYQINKIPELVVKSIRVSHFVICTTDILAEKIRQYNESVYVIENGIDSSDPVWTPKKIDSTRIRFGFTQGTTHKDDIAMLSLHTTASLIDLDFRYKGQIVLCGFDAQPDIGSMSIGYEKMLTNSLNVPIGLKYAESLKQLKQPDGTDKAYRRIWARPVKEYGTVYNEIDVSVCPLRKTIFNSCKSNLKLLEAGFMDCAVIVSAVDPYLPMANRNNAFLLSDKNFFEWQQYIIKNPSIVKDKAGALKESVLPYSLQNLSIKRKQIYESL